MEDESKPNSFTNSDDNLKNFTTSDEIEPDEEVFTTLGGFSSDILNTLGSVSEALAVEQRRPMPLASSGHDLSYTVKLIQDLIVYDTDEPDAIYQPEPLDIEGQLVAVSHLLSAVVTTLEARHLRRLATRLASDTSHWLSKLFRYFDATAFLHEDAREGIIRVARMIIFHKYPNFTSNGYAEFQSKQPIIYTNTSVRPGLPQHIASQLGLGTEYIRTVPCNTVIGSPAAMDTATLDRMMEEDSNSNCAPLLVIANAGGGIIGGVDNLPRIQELCTKYNAWLHVEGHSLAAVMLPNTPNLPAKIGDSMTLPLSVWLGIPSLQYVTLYRTCSSPAVYASGLTSLSLHVRLSSLPMWMTLQNLGHNGVISRVKHSFEITQHLQKVLISMEHIRLISPHRKHTSGILSIQELCTRPVSTSQLLDTACGTIVFQYVENKLTDNKNSEYYDSLNSWLGQVVRRDVSAVPLELVHLVSVGLVLRWSSLEGPNTQNITIDHVDQFIQSLKCQIEILNATVSHRAVFRQLVQSDPSLELCEIPMWAGLGGVRYIPELYIDKELDESTNLDINRLNEHLVFQLRSTDSAFSHGENAAGFNCIRFGMVTADTDIQELLSLVISTGKEIETSSKYFIQMTEVVKKGIETATADLERENAERLWQEGILRHVPLVSSVYNWLSPPPPPGIKGRTLDLTAGVLESTENTYRYHMQVRHGVNGTSSESKLPPTPSIVTSVSPTGSTPTPSHSNPTPSHSRSSSASDQKHLPQADSRPIPSVLKTHREVPIEEKLDCAKEACEVAKESEKQNGSVSEPLKVNGEVDLNSSVSP